MHIKRLLVLLTVSWPLALPVRTLAAHQATVFSAPSCRANPLVPDQDRTLMLCAQIAQTGATMTLIATGPVGPTCLGRVVSAAGRQRAQLAPDGELLHTIGPGGHLYWHWSPGAATRYGAHVEAVIACGKANSIASDQREVLFTIR
ncbi:MAG TPA: hypothetical protein VHB98_10235 [Chloroflexota bacterium]|nr:hypothetical protein [Chloroflexota bacterium]